MKLIKNDTEMIHSAALLVIVLMTLLSVFFIQNFLFRTLSIMPVIFLFIRNGLSFYHFRLTLTLSLFFSLTFFFLGVFYPAARMMKGEVVEFMGGFFYREVIEHSAFLVYRLFLMSFISMASVYVLSYEKIVLYCLQARFIPIQFGYPLLMALNTIALFKTEFDKLKLSLRMRGVNVFQLRYALFPLLVFSVRQSQRGALSLLTRGMSETKNYYFNYGLNSVDHMSMISIFVFQLSLLLLERVF